MHTINSNIYVRELIKKIEKNKFNPKRGSNIYRLEYYIINLFNM